MSENYNEVEKLEIRPFTKFCMSIGAVPSSYLAGLSIEEQLLWLCSYLEKEVIPAVNNNGEAVEELQELFTELQTYVNNYFTNLDVQDEINDKLDAMAENGTLANIINQEIFGQLNTRITTLESEVSKTPDFLLGVSFKADGTNLPTETDLIISLDGVNFSNIKIPELLLRDPSIAYDSTRHKFYMTCTPPTQTDYTILLYDSSDLINWTEHQIAIPNYLTNLKWAPDLYYDETNDKLIVSFSYQYGTETDINGDSYPAFDIIFCETNDFENFTMTNVRVANLISRPHRNHIDSNIININNVWYLAVKDDYQKVIEIYQSSNLTDFSLLCGNILNNNSTADNTIYLEGPSQYYFNGEYHLMADSYAHLHGIVNTNSTDYQDFDFACTNLNYFRHNSVIVISDIEAKKIIADLPEFNLSTSDKLTPSPEYQPAIYIKANQNKEMTAIPNSIMFIEGNATISNLRNPFNCNEQKFEFITNPDITLNITKVDNITKNIKLINTTFNNEKTISLNLNENSNIFGRDTFEEIEYYDKATLVANISHIDSNIEISDAVAYKSGNVISVFLDIKVLNTIDTWINELFRFTSYKFIPRVKTQWSSTIMTNLAMFNSGILQGNFRGTANAHISLSATYITK